MKNWNFSWDMYGGQLKWLEQNTIYLTVHGSHAYGTSIPTSDVDYRGIAIAPVPYYYGILNNFETTKQNEDDKEDLVIFEIRKFFKLATVANPNAIELLFTPEECHIHVNSFGQMLLDNRDIFVSKMAYHTFRGYAFSQFNRLMTHAAYVEGKEPPLPTRAEFGLPEMDSLIPKDQLKAAEAAIKKVIDVWNWKELDSVDPDIRIGIQTEFHDKLLQITGWNQYDLSDKMWNAAVKSLGFDSNFIEYISKEKQYKAKLNHYNAYQSWKKNRNPARAEMEAKFGMDCKFAMHIVRLYLQCKYLLRDGVFHVLHPDAPMLIDIRNGAWTKQQLSDFVEKMDAEIKELYDTSTIIPYAPDRVKIDQLCISMVEKYLAHGL